MFLFISASNLESRNFSIYKGDFYWIVWMETLYCSFTLLFLKTKISYSI